MKVKQDLLYDFNLLKNVSKRYYMIYFYLKMCQSVIIFKIDFLGLLSHI